MNDLRITEADLGREVPRVLGIEKHVWWVSVVSRLKSCSSADCILYLKAGNTVVLLHMSRPLHATNYSNFGKTIINRTLLRQIRYRSAKVYTQTSIGFPPANNLQQYLPRLQQKLEAFTLSL